MKRLPKYTPAEVRNDPYGLTILALNLLLAIFGMSAYTSFSTDGKTTVIEMNEDSVSYEE